MSRKKRIGGGKRVTNPSTLNRVSAKRGLGTRGPSADGSDAASEARHFLQAASARSFTNCDSVPASRQPQPVNAVHGRARSLRSVRDDLQPDATLDWMFRSGTSRRIATLVKMRDPNRNRCRPRATTHAGSKASTLRNSLSPILMAHPKAARELSASVRSIHFWRCAHCGAPAS